MEEKKRNLLLYLSRAPRIRFCEYSYEQNVKHMDVLKWKQKRLLKTLSHISN